MEFCDLLCIFLISSEESFNSAACKVCTVIESILQSSKDYMLKYDKFMQDDTGTVLVMKLNHDSSTHKYC